jgi:quercetin dioxygenase-like cupin family protein
MTPSTTIVDLFTHDLRFGSRETVRADERRMVADGDADWRCAIFHAETDDDVHADHWERHPLADEVVCCLRGAIRLYLRAAQPDTPDDLVQLLPGQAAIVPRDRWHRLDVDEPGDLLAITVRPGTQLENRTTSDARSPRPHSQWSAATTPAWSEGHHRPLSGSARGVAAKLSASAPSVQSGPGRTIT